MSSPRFEDIEVGDIVTVERLSIQDHTNPTITGEVGFVDHEAVLLTIYICGISQAVCSDNHTLVDITKKPIELPEVGRPVKVWNRFMKDETLCYGYWTGHIFTGTNYFDGVVSTFEWPKHDEAFRYLQWEYIDEEH